MARLIRRAYVATYCYYRHRNWPHDAATSEARTQLARLAAVALFLAPLLPVSFVANVVLGGVDLRAYHTADGYLLAILGMFELIHTIRNRFCADDFPVLNASDFDAARIMNGRWDYWRLAGMYTTVLMGWILGAMLLQLAA
jgi:hypothetical protein